MSYPAPLAHVRTLATCTDMSEGPPALPTSCRPRKTDSARRTPVDTGPENGADLNRNREIEYILF